MKQFLSGLQKVLIIIATALSLAVSCKCQMRIGAGLNVGNKLQGVGFAGYQYHNYESHFTVMRPLVRGATFLALDAGLVLDGKLRLYGGVAYKVTGFNHSQDRYMDHVLSSGYEVNHFVGTVGMNVFIGKVMVNAGYCDGFRVGVCLSWFNKKE